MSTETTTAYIIAHTFPVPETPCVDFTALATAYTSDTSWRLAVNEIFASVASFLYWTVVQKVRSGKAGNASHLDFFHSNRLACLEHPEYVENRIRAAAHKTIRRCCALNCSISRNGGQRFLTRAFQRNDEGEFTVADAKELAMTIAALYEERTGKSICETKWFAE